MTEISLKDYIERILDERQRALELGAKPMSEFKEKTEERLDKLESHQANMTGRFWALGAFLGAFSTALVLFATIILKFWR